MSMPTDPRPALSAMGNVLGPDVLAAVQDLYREEQSIHAAAQPAALVDATYGGDPRQRLDLYAPPNAADVPIVLWVHGGGFLRGDKGGGADAPFNAHAGRWAARAGMLGAVMNYRLAPAAAWPAGGEDVVAAVAWLRKHAATYGGDPARIVLVGTSAGAVHVAGALRLDPALPIAGAVLLSGLYGFTPLDARDEQYYGSPEDYGTRMPMAAVVDTALPLLLAGAEYDPPRFQAELVGLLQARLAAHGRMPRAYIASGHNHFSLAYHLGTADTRLADEILSFIGDLA